MNDKTKKFLKGTMFVLAGVLSVYVLGGIVRPLFNDSAHAIGVMNAKGGAARHPVEFEINNALFGQFRLMLTAQVLPPVSGDLIVELIGPEELDYAVSSRYPPGVPLYNRLDRWYTFEAPIFKGVTTGSDMVISLRIKPPEEAGRYALTVTDNNTGQVYLTVPVIFSKDGVVPVGEDCH